MFGSENTKLVKECADRCNACGCYKIPRMIIKRELGEDVATVVLRCAECGLEGTGKNIHLAIVDWNKRHRLKIENRL